MEGWSLLSAFSLAMFIGSYLAGSIPLAFTFSETRMRMISIFGAGLLVGTALSVIIPEGVEALYDSRIETVHPRHDHHHDHNGHEAKNILEQNSLHQPEHPPRLIPRDVQQPDGVGDGKESRSKRQIPPVDGRHLLQVQQSPPGNKGVEEHGHEEHGHGTHQSIGIALVMGFLLMLVVDQVTRSASSRSIDGISRPRIKITATVGLVVHAAADGIALGSAASTNKTDVQFIVFVAIMLHKAPAAFGLVTFLLLEGLERHRIKRHLLIFALAAPLMAIFTFYTLTVIGSETLSGGSTTGILMLFSAGTFLYVATVHVLPELVNQRSSGGDISFTSGHSHSSGVAFNVIELVSLIVGAVLPAILSLGHSH